MTDRMLPEGWRWVQFGDVVRQVKATSRDPRSVGLSRIVGLSHLDSDSLPLRRWDELDELPDGTSFTRIFRAGQVLFGKRRAYQRKVAVADFDGLCSGDILVFETSSEELRPDFLPFLVQSDGFFDHALGTSAGSLSPRTKWQDLAKYQFVLPSLRHQEHVVELLTAFDALSTQLKEATLAAQQLRDSLISDEVTSGPSEVLGSLLDECDYGISAAPEAAGDVPILRMNNLDGTELNFDDLRWVPASAVSEHDYVSAGDILFNRTNSVEHVGKVALVPKDLQPMTFASYLIRLRVNTDRVLPAFVTGFLQSAVGRSRIGRFVTRGVSQANVNSTNLKKVLIPVPPLESQEGVIKKWHRTRELQESIDGHIATCRHTAACLRESALSGELDV